jgi:gamma-glutamyl hercynylcysteine S-oxide synthase
MATVAVKSSVPVPSPAQAVAALQRARRQTLALVAELSDEQLTRVHSPIMSPLVWDLGHIAAYEDLWLAHRLGGLELLRAHLAERYDAFETPRAVRGQIDLLGPSDAREYLRRVRERTLELIGDQGVADPVILEMVVRHELQHSETMRQTLAIAGQLACEDRAAMDRPRTHDDDGHAVEHWVTFPAGPFTMGAPAQRFSYDNERPRHSVRLDAFQIAREPVSAGMWMSFVRAGGYRRRELWSPAGWAWLREQPTEHHPAIAHARAQAPVCHVSWYEANAFARAHGARLPSEAEWERAAGDAGRALADVGRVWEWTSTPFDGYPGFQAHPYREYSEVFFGSAYRVLRGGSWATHRRVAGVTFRNWDLPARRQIFAGLRLARDA